MGERDDPRPNRSFHAGDFAWLLVVLTVGLAVRLFEIDGKPFWLDEVLTFRRIHLGVGDVIADSLTNRHMPSYFLMLHFFARLGDGAAMLRLPSAVFGALSGLAVYAIARRIGGRVAGFVAGLLMALSPQQVQYGQEARSYTLVTLLIAVALWGLIRLADTPASACRGLRDPQSEGIGWAAYLLGTVGALDVLGNAAPWLIVSNLSLYLIWRRLPDGSRQFPRTWLLVHVAIAALCLPFYCMMLAADDGQFLGKFDWIPQLSWHRLWVSAGSVYLMRASAVVHLDLLPTAVPMLAPIVAALGALGLWRMRGRVEGPILLLVLAALPLPLLAASLYKPMLIPRYLLWSAVPFYVLAGLGAASLPRRALPASVGVLALLAAVNLAPFYRTETKPRWDLAAATLATKVRPGDTVLTADQNAPDMLMALQPKAAISIDTRAVVTRELDVAVARWKQGGRVWAVHGRSGLGERELLADFKTRISALGAPALQMPMGNEITILLFAPPGARCPQPGSVPEDGVVMIDDGVWNDCG